MVEITEDNDTLMYNLTSASSAKKSKTPILSKVC